MKIRAWLVAVATVAAALAEPGMRRVYLDAQDGKRHAIVNAELEGEAGRERLVLRLRPDGIEVQRDGGWQSRDGINAHTAREMGSLFRVKGFEARLRGVDGSFHPARVTWEARYASFPRRSLRTDGTIDYLARTEALIEELELQTTTDLRGTQSLELSARGEPRLLLEYDVAGRRLTGMRMPGHSAAIPIQALQAEQEKVVALPLPDDWAEREPEAKWSFFAEEVRDDVVVQKRLVQALANARDWIFLEQIALYVPAAYGTHSIGVILAGANAPNWRRTAAWFLTGSSGHGIGHSTSVLAQEQHKARSLGWMKKHEKRLDPALLALKAGWEAQGLAPQDPDGDLPPWTEDEVFGAMSAAFREPRRDLKDSDVAQVSRAIEGWVVSQRWGSPWGEKVVELIADPDWRIARAACLAFTHENLPAVPMKDLWAVTENEKKDPRLREAAFLSWTYGTWAEVFPKLHDIAEDPANPFWSPAVSRLGDLGIGWTVDLLESLDVKDAARKKLLAQEIDLLRRKFGAGGHHVTDMDATVAAIVFGFRRSADMEDWLLEHYGSVEGDTAALRREMRHQKFYLGRDLPPKVLKDAAAVRERLLEELDHRWETARRKKAGK